jgi:organic hydroperoxide reductase OsmC/OhrA
MSATTIEYRLLPGTRATVGSAGTHSVIADRPDGSAGGLGLGFNGGQLLALAIGGCFCNDLQALADEMDLAIADLGATVTIEFGGEPRRATAARMHVDCTLGDGSDPTPLIERAKAITIIGNSVREGVPLTIG